MVIKKKNLQWVSSREMPETLPDLLDELAQFSPDGSVKVVYQSENTADIDFYKIISSSLNDLVKEGENHRVRSGGYDIELDGDLMGYTSPTAEESAQQTLRLCYQVGMLRLYSERGENDYDIDDLDVEMQEWSFETSRERLQLELLSG